MGASVILANVMKYIAESLPDLGPPRVEDHSVLTWINNKHTLHTSNTIISSIVINKYA